MISIDHFIPISKGGTSDLENLVPACRTCNLTKRDFDIESFRLRQLKKSSVFFSDEQKDYLSKLGVDLPQISPHAFWFEEQGL